MRVPSVFRRSFLLSKVFDKISEEDELKASSWSSCMSEGRKPTTLDKLLMIKFEDPSFEGQAIK